MLRDTRAAGNSGYEERVVPFASGDGFRCNLVHVSGARPPVKGPVLLVHVIYRDPNVYDVYCEPFADRVTLARRGGLEEKRRLVQRYAERLEHYVRRAPSNWFNFYDFWQHR